jgi:SAM-dependent methyltransferase
MSEPAADMSTDSAWEEWGKRDPYYGVITHPKFRRAVMDEAAMREFFGASEMHARHTLSKIREQIDADFSPRKILDFGCGVGRLLVAFAALADEVVGADVSVSMLEEARRNCEQWGLANVRLVQSDDELSALNEKFDLIHSFIVFQHIPVARGYTILANLLQRLRPGGVAAIHLTYSKTQFAATRGVAPAASPSPAPAAMKTASDGDPEIQMNPYNMNEILYLIQTQGIRDCHVEFIDHGGELGVFLYFSMPR